MEKENKKRFLLGITSVFQLVILLIAFISPEKIVSTELAKELKESAGLGIFVVTIIFAMLLWDEIKYIKNRLIGPELFLILLGPGVGVRFIALVNILILTSVKYERKEKINMKEAVKRLYVKPVEWTSKNWLLLIALLFIYFGQNFIQEDWLENLSPLTLIIFIITLHLVLLILAILAFYTEIKAGATLIRKDFKLTIRYMLKLFVKMLIAMTIATTIAYAITEKTTSVNQESIESMPMYITIPLAVLWAPFVEETVFRGAIKRIIKHKLLFIVVSGVLFGFLHAVGEATFGIAVATSLPYVVIGMVFAYSYARTNNIAVNILFHMLYNLLAVFASMLK